CFYWIEKDFLEFTGMDSPIPKRYSTPLRATAWSELAYWGEGAHQRKYVLLFVHYGVNVQIMQN
ncbi:MAG: hypothetical protein CMH45_07060, partial [Muricauda sp.]|nr:hypothetical protein [Allomuricauda sp.]